MTGVRARWLALVHAFTLNVIFQRLMPFYRLRQTGKSMTLLPSATHIEIASAMTLKPTQFFVFQHQSSTQIKKLYTKRFSFSIKSN